MSGSPSSSNSGHSRPPASMVVSTDTPISGANPSRCSSPTRQSGFGGHSRAALRRTARHGDGWHPVGAIAASPLPPQEMRAHLDTLKRLTDAEGRDFSALTISYKAPLYDTGIPDRDGARRSFSGKADEIAGDIHTFAAA